MGDNEKYKLRENGGNEKKNGEGTGILCPFFIPLSDPNDPRSLKGSGKSLARERDVARLQFN